MIAQHLYTREARGYGTVARSGGLTDEAIKQLILPYCSYAAGAGGKCLLVVNHPCGQLLIGQAVDRGKGFFQHNYLIPPEEANTALEMLWQGIAFKTAHPHDDPALPALGTLPKPEPPDAGALPYSFCDSTLTYLIHCITLSTAGNKKIYIAPPDGGVHPFACALLEALYTRLPLPMRHLLGFCTHTREPLNKRGIHLVFVDKARFLCPAGHFFVDFTRQSGIMAVSTENTNPYTARFAHMSAEKFCAHIFNEIGFWRKRAPHILYESAFQEAVRGRLAQVLQAPMPSPANPGLHAFLRHGKSGRYASIIGHTPADFVMYEASSHENAQDFLGNYRIAHSYKELL